jgi:hypothetical protein
MAASAIPFALAQRNAPKQSVAKLESASKGLMRAGNVLPTTIIVVTNTNDSGPGSLRDALAAANDGDTIDATGVSGTILLTSGELQINHNVIINGPGAENLAVNGTATFTVFENLASNVTISGLTITNGNGGVSLTASERSRSATASLSATSGPTAAASSTKPRIASRPSRSPTAPLVTTRPPVMAAVFSPKA